MFRLLIFSCLFCFSQFANSQATLIHYLRNWEATADSIIQSHFDSCFYVKNISMDIKDAQIVHSEGQQFQVLFLLKLQFVSCQSPESLWHQQLVCHEHSTLQMSKLTQHHFFFIIK